MAVLTYKVTNAGYQVHVADVYYFQSSTEFDRLCKIQIQNQGSETTYYKIVSNSENWSVVYPTNGELGNVNAGSTQKFDFTIRRTAGIPSAPSSETVNLTVEAYSDSSYTNKVGELSFDLYFYYVNSSSETEVQKWDFDDNTTQGWTLDTFTLSENYSIGAGGSSLYIGATGTSNTGTASITGVSVPSTNKVYMFVHIYTTGDTGGTHNARVTIRVNGVDEYVAEFNPDSLGLYDQWVQVGIDVTDYTGQTVSLEVEGFVYASSGENIQMYVDDILIVGTNSL